MKQILINSLLVGLRTLKYLDIWSVGLHFTFPQEWISLEPMK